MVIQYRGVAGFSGVFINRLLVYLIKLSYSLEVTAVLFCRGKKNEQKLLIKVEKLCIVYIGLFADLTLILTHLSCLVLNTRR